MGRQESLTSLALGRGPYEDEVIETADDGRRPNGQQYSENGRPRNPETRKRERDHIRAANEVLQVTGIVEDVIAAKSKAREALDRKNRETLSGLRFMESGRAILVAGVWGVMGFRRRILLYKPYSTMGISEVIRMERSKHSIDALFFSGIPTVIAYNISDWIAFFLDTIVDTIFDEGEDDMDQSSQLRLIIQGTLDVVFCYITLHFRLFAILQQLHLIPSSKLLPGLKSFIPFTGTSPISLPPPLSFNLQSVLQCGLALFKTLSPMLAILIHGKIKFYVSRIVYRPIYKTLPRPTGDSMFSGLGVSAPALEYDAPDQDFPRGDGEGAYSGTDESTLRALEGLPSLTPTETRSRPTEGRDNSDDDDGEVAQAPLISFDVEAPEGAESSLGTWSAELRSSNEPKVSKEIKYRVTGFTMLPPIMATEALREVVAGIIVMPLEAIMVRIIGRAFRVGAGAGVEDIWTIPPTLRTYSFRNILPALGLQVAITGIVWAGFTVATHLWVENLRDETEQKPHD